MTLREQYNKLENNIYNEYQRLVNIKSYDILTQTVNEYYNTVSDEILEIIENEGIEEAVMSYDILECLEQVYYNDRSGDERLCYLLGVEREDGLRVYDDETSQTIFISLSDLNGKLQEIIVVEAMQNS